MALASRLGRWGAARIARRLAVSVPYFGAAIALVTIGAAVRRKGVVGGTVDTGLNAVPYLGAVKNTIEVLRGRDFIRDRPVTTPPQTEATAGR